MANKTSSGHARHILEHSLVLTCVSAYPLPPMTCGSLHASESAAANHAALLERRREDGKNLDGKKPRTWREQRTGPWRPQWCSPAFLGLQRMAPDAEAE